MPPPDRSLHPIALSRGRPRRGDRRRSGDGGGGGLLRYSGRPEGTLERAAGGTLRVGACHRKNRGPAWTTVRSGVEVDLIQEFAAGIDAKVEWHDGGEGSLIEQVQLGARRRRRWPDGEVAMVEEGRAHPAVRGSAQPDWFARAARAGGQDGRERSARGPRALPTRP